MPAAIQSRLTGWALILAALLLGVGTPLAAGLRSQLPDAGVLWTPVHMLVVAGYLLLVLGLPGLYASMAGASGRIGLLAFVWAELVAGLMPGIAAIDLYATPIIGSAPSAGWLLAPGGALGDFELFRHMWLEPALLAGLTLLGFAAWRARTRARWAWLPMLLGLVTSVATGYGIFNLVTYAALAWLGVPLARSTSTPQR